MLKSFSTQLAATAFFGPLGLAYTSMATAVLFTLILVVLYFTGLGPLAILLVWPVSIVTGVLYVKFHNDRIRQSGNSLLLGPGHDEGLVSAAGSWARGIAVLAIIFGLGFLAYKMLPFGRDEVTVPGRIVDASSTSDSEAVTDSATNTITGTGTGTETDNKIIRTEKDEAAVTAANSSDAPVITLPSREIPKVIVDSDGQATTTISGESGLGESGVGDNSIVAQTELYVDRDVVNLRQGPGTQFAIVTQLDRNEALYEFARDGEWVNIETQSGSYAGWIHGNLVRR